MATNKLLEATNGIVSVLEPLESEERARVIQAALTVLGVSNTDMSPIVTTGMSSVGQTTVGINRSAPASGGEKAFFDSKQPASKIEELAVAARYREEALGFEQSSKDELKAIIKGARRNFDDHNFKRDLNNARTSGLFNKGGGQEEAVLSHYGQNYVDALPDREKIKLLRKPASRRSGAKKSSKNSKAAKS